MLPPDFKSVEHFGARVYTMQAEHATNLDASFPSLEKSYQKEAGDKG
jgi:hypothetical protein